MTAMNNFTVIPALDLKGGLVVHAIGGDRAAYSPIASPFGAADDPVAVARGLLATTGSPDLYVADLDAIAGIGNHFELVRGLSYALPHATLWISIAWHGAAHKRGRAPARNDCRCRRWHRGRRHRGPVSLWSQAGRGRLRQGRQPRRMGSR